MIKLILIILAVLSFVFAAFPAVGTFGVALIPLGLAFFAASFLPWKD